MKKLIFLFFALAWISGCTSLKTPELNGVVVDAETGKPIGGARIYAKWQKTVSGPGGKTGGAIGKELRLQVREDGRFAIPAYTLRNYMPYPFGQGGTFYMIVYAHGYMYKRFTLFSDSGFDHEDIIKDYAKPKGIVLRLISITSPDEWRKNISEIPEHELIKKNDDWIRVKNDFVDGEYKLLVDRFGMKRWDKFNQSQLVKAYIRFSDYKSAIRKIEEIIQDYPDSAKYYAEELAQYRSKLTEIEKRKQ